MVDNIPDKKTGDGFPVQHRVYPDSIGMPAVAPQNPLSHNSPRIPFPPAYGSRNPSAEIRIVKCSEHFPHVMKPALCADFYRRIRTAISHFYTSPVFMDKFPDERCLAFPLFNETGYLSDDIIAGFEKHPVYSDSYQIRSCSY